MVEEITQEWMELYRELFIKQSKVNGYNKLIKTDQKFEDNQIIELITPIPFWFTQESQLYLPILSMPYTELKIDIDTTDFIDLININHKQKDGEFKLLIEYV